MVVILFLAVSLRTSMRHGSRRHTERLASILGESQFTYAIAVLILVDYDEFAFVRSFRR